jgi:uncharacterized protein DUF4342
MGEQTWRETIHVSASQLVDAVKKLVHEGNVRRVIVKQGDRTIAEFPLTAGVIGTVIAPVLAAVAAIAVLISDCTLVVERAVDGGTQRPEP